MRFHRLPFPPSGVWSSRNLSQPLLEKFVAFEETPLAAASLGQVHRARITQTPAEELGQVAPALESGSDSTYNVVVKVQRPNIERLIETDLAALRTVGAWLHRYRPIRKRANVPALIAEFTKILYEEIDYLAEGRNAEIFAENFSQFAGVRVPGVYWTHTTRRVLTLENVFAIKITDYQAITDAGVSRSGCGFPVAGYLSEANLRRRLFPRRPPPRKLVRSPATRSIRNGGGSGSQLGADLCRFRHDRKSATEPAPGSCASC